MATRPDLFSARGLGLKEYFFPHYMEIIMGLSFIVIWLYMSKKLIELKSSIAGMTGFPTDRSKNSHGSESDLHNMLHG